MKEKVPVRKTYHHETLGDLRTVRTGDSAETMLFCVKDISRMLGYKSGGTVLIRNCKNISKYGYSTVSGMQTLNFISYSDLNDQFTCRMGEQWDALYAFVHEQILPEAFPKPSPTEMPAHPVMPYDAYDEILRIAGELSDLIGKLLELNQRLVDFVDIDA